MKIKLLFLFLVLISNQTFSTDYYTYQGKKIQLEPRNDKVALILKNNVSENTLREKLSFAINGGTLIKSTPGIFLLNFASVKTPAEVESIINQISAGKEIIKAVTRVYYGTSKKVSQILTDKFIVRLRNSSDADKLNVLNIENKCTVAGKIRDDKGFVIETNADAVMDVLELTELYMKSGLFEYAEPDFIYPEGCLLLSVPNDVFFTSQWAVRNSGQTVTTGSAFVLQGDAAAVSGIPGADMNVSQAWDYTTGSSAIKVGIIDSGIDSLHIDLQAPGHLMAGYDAFNDINSSAVDYADHGTSVAGLIGAVMNNNIGISGIAPDCKLMSIAIFDINGNTSNSIIARAFDTASVRGIDILNNSWGGGTPSQTITDAINNAAINGRNGLGCVILFASGNDGRNPPVYPSALPNVICVGSSTPHDQRKSQGTGNQFFWGSNYGEDSNGDLDITAPTNCYTLLLGNAYEPNFWGSSASSANAAGVAALVLSVNPSQSRLQAFSNLMRGCTKIDNVPYYINKTYGKWCNYYGYGRVNAYTSVRLAAGTDVTPPTINHTNVFSHSSTYPTILKAEIIDHDGSAVPNAGSDIPKIFYKIRKNGGSWSGFDSAGAYTIAGNDFYFKIPSQGWETEIYYYIRARDNSGNETTFPKHAPNSFWLSYFAVGNITADTKKISAFSGADFGATLSSPVTYSSFRIVHTKVKIYMRHTWLDDESIILFSPLTDANNNRKCLFSNNGYDMDNITGASVTDSSGSWWIQGTPPYLNGQYKPEFSFSGYNGQSASGSWRILHFDRGIGDYAFFDSVKITLCKTTGTTSSAVRLNSPSDSIVLFDSSAFPNIYYKNFYLKNSGNANLTANNITFSGTYASMFSLANTPPATIAANDSALFKVKLNTGAGGPPNGLTYENAVMNIQTNDPSKSNFKVSLQTNTPLQSGLKNLQLTVLFEGMYDAQSNTSVADTANVLLRSVNSPYTPVDSVQSILNTSGAGSFNFANAQNNVNYYLVVKHRNGLETWSAGGNSFNSSVMTYNFTTAAAQAYGSNLMQNGSKYCIYSGDIYKDGIIDVSDITMVHNASFGVETGYFPEDVNGDNFVDVTDLVITHNNSLALVRSIVP